MNKIFCLIALLTMFKLEAQNDICLTTASYSPLNQTELTSAVAFADFNHDGRIDFVVAPINSGELDYWTGNASGNFSHTAYINGPVNSTVKFVIDVDFNNDGWQDLAASVQSILTGSILIYINNGGTFSQAMSFTVDPDPSLLAASDLNGDNKPELVVAHSTTANTIQVFKNNGNLSFTSLGTYATCSFQSALILRDFDQDGKIDIFTGAPGCSRFFKNNGNGTFNPQPFGTLSSYGYYSLCTATSLMADNDALQDLACSSGSTIVIYKNLGNFNFLVTQTLSTDYMAQAVSVCDMNSDGKTDLCAASFWRTLHVYENNGQGFFTAKWRDSLNFNGTPTYIKGIDLNNDNKDDMFLGHDNSSKQDVYINCNTKEVGIGDNTSKKFRIYPTPATSLLNLDIEPEYNDATVNILDNFGRVIFSAVWKSNQIDVSLLPAGSYYLKISNAFSAGLYAQFIKIQD